MRLMIITIGILCLTNSYCQNYYDKIELREDIEYFFKSIKNTHVDANYYNKDIDTLKEYIISKLPDSLKRLDFEYLLMKHTNNYFDIHTGLNSYYFGKIVTNNSYMLPINVIIRSGFVQFKYNDSCYTINSINSFDIKDILYQFSKYCKADMSPPVKDRFYEKYFSSLFLSEYGQFDDFLIGVNRDNSQLRLNAKTYLEINSNITNDENFRIDLNMSDSIAYIKVNSFRYKYHDNFKSFLDSAFDKIDSLNYQYLVIDIRHNGGGSDNLVNLILDYLFPKTYSIIYGFNQFRVDSLTVTKGNYTWTRRMGVKTMFNGPVIVLQSTATASAAASFTSAIKTSSRGLIVGEITHDPAYAFSSAISFQMPNSKIQFRCAQGLYAMPGAHYDVHYGFEPHIDYEFKSFEIDSTELNSIVKLTKDLYKGYYMDEYFK